jgi:hypothetical protein
MRQTWLNPNITDNEILPENTGYNIFHKDRKHGYGGVMLAIKAEIVSEPVDSDTPCDCLLYLDLARFRNQIECLGCSNQGGSIGFLVYF